MLAPQLLEVLPVQRAHLELFDGDSARRPGRRLVEQCLLAKALTGAEHGKRDDVAERRRDANRHPATLDHIEQVTGFTLVEQPLALAIGASHHRSENGATIDLGQSAERAGLHALTIDAVHAPLDVAERWTAVERSVSADTLGPCRRAL